MRYLAHFYVFSKVLNQLCPEGRVTLRLLDLGTSYASCGCFALLLMFFGVTWRSDFDYKSMKSGCILKKGRVKQKLNIMMKTCVCGSVGLKLLCGGELTNTTSIITFI